MTHSPEPLSEQEAFTLSWEAATKRLEAAGSIPVREAELMAEALRSNEAGIEVGLKGMKRTVTTQCRSVSPWCGLKISLPPLFENQEDREKLANGLKRSRNRFRQFRSRLSQEIMQSNGE